MKIIFLVHQFYPEFHGGTEKIIFNNALMAQKNGFKVKVITYSFYNDSFYDHENMGIYSKEFAYQGIPVLAFKYKNQPVDINIELDNQILYVFAQSIIDAETPDIIHVGHPMRVHEFVRAAKDKNIPYIITLTDFFLLCPKVILAPDNNSLCSGPRNGTACKVLCKEFNEVFIQKRLHEAYQILSNSKIIISPSNFVAQKFKQEFDNIDVRIINHGIRYKNIQQNNYVYKKGNIFTFGYAGNLAYHKGVHILLKAFSEIDDENLRLAIYGSGLDEFVYKLKEIVGNDHRVTFHGSYAAEQLGDIFTEIDVLITPSICYESYSLVLHEALASNVPVIASNLGGMAESMINGSNGFTFRPGDPEDLKSKMNIIINNPEILNEIKKFIKKNIVIPSVEQEAYNYFKIYNRIYQTQ